MNNSNRNINIKRVVPSKNVLLKAIKIILIIVLILVLVNLAYYYFTNCYEKKDLIDYLTSFSLEPCVMESKSKSLPYAVRELEHDKEVFHIGNQDYTYKQAKCKCAAYDARLATKEEVIDSYNKGANWCSYGWSEGQTAYYPTQKCSWDKLQRGPKRKRNDCGMPGVNGGFFANPDLRFGTNCYGVKPRGRVVKEKRPKCKRKQFCKRKDNHRSAHKLETDKIVPFNNDRWSRF